MQTRLKLKQPIELEQNKKEREDIYIYEDFSKATVAIRKENWEKVKALRQRGKYAILVYDKIYLRDKLQVNNLLKLSYN